MQHQCASNTVKKCPHDAPNRDLRRGFLGNCWVYDIRSSVIKWKMGFARDYLTSIGQTENDDVRLLHFPPKGLSDLGRGCPEDRLAFGIGWSWAGGGVGKVDDQPGVVTQFAKGLGQHPQIPMPEKLVRADREIGIKKNFQGFFHCIAKQLWV